MPQDFPHHISKEGREKKEEDEENKSKSKKGDDRGTTPK
jgi:hypothetical protein